MSMEADGTVSAFDNLQTVLDTVPGVAEAYGVPGVTESEDWITAYGADLETIKALREKAGCVDNKFGHNSLKGAYTLALSLTTALGVSTLFA